MRPEHFVTIDIEQGGGGLSRPIISGAVMRILHGVFKQNPGKFAIAIPEHGFEWIRVFTDNRENLDLLHDNIKDSHVIKAYARFGYPQEVPKNFSGKWKRYARFRIPSRNSERKEGGTLRLRRIEQTEEMDMPFFIVQSKSNGGQFSLHIYISDAQPSDNCEPDSYGLSVTTRPFGLPIL